MMVDPVESVRGEVLRRIVQSGAFPLEAIQRENSAAPDVLPYCRLTMAQGAEWDYSSQRITEKTVIAEIDVFTSSMGGNTQLAGQLASAIEAEFGLFDRSPEARTLPLPGWDGASAEITRIARSSTAVEADRALYKLPVLLYIRITLLPGASYDAV